jgi:antitoxin CptB
MESISKLKWRCRRGTKELDFLMEGYLDKHYSLANKNEQALFVELLNLQDSQLIIFLLGEQLPSSKGLASLVKKIRNQSNF